MSDPPLGPSIRMDDDVVVQLRATGTSNARPPKTGPRRPPRMTTVELEAMRLDEMDARQVNRLGELPDDKHLGQLARIATMRVLVAFLTGNIKPKTPTEWIKIAETSHRIAMAEMSAHGETDATSVKDAHEELERIAAKARQQASG